MDTAEIQQQHKELRPEIELHLGSTGHVTEDIRQALLLEVVKLTAGSSLKI
jgi:hypothetical protein